MMYIDNSDQLFSKIVVEQRVTTDGQRILRGVGKIHRP